MMFEKQYKLGVHLLKGLFIHRGEPLSTVVRCNPDGHVKVVPEVPKLDHQKKDDLPNAVTTSVDNSQKVGEKHKAFETETKALEDCKGRAGGASSLPPLNRVNVNEKTYISYQTL